MADELTNALAGLQYTPLDTGWGIGAQGVAQALPNLVNPYASPLQNLGVTLGGALVASLLGYQAKKEAFDLGLQTQQYANQMSALTTPEARTDFLAALPSEAIGSGVGGRLSALSRALTQQEALQKLAIGQEVAKQKALAMFELGPEGTKLFERKTQAELDRALAVAGATRTKQQLPTGVNTAITEASTFADAAKVQRDRIAAMDPVKLKIILTTGVNLGESGFNQANEAVVQLYRKANFGATLTGQEKKAADIITGKNLTATKADIIAAWDTLIDLNNKRAQRTVEVATSSPEQLLQMFGTGAKMETPGGESEAAKKNRELKERLAKLEALATQRK